MPSTLPPSTTGITATSTTTTTTTTTTPTNPNDPNPSPSTNPNPTTAAQPPKPRYVVSPSGHAAHPDEILASCRALQAHVAQLCATAEADVARLEERIRARELAEKRRVAPGWLDSEARLLEPERAAGAGSGGNTIGGGAGGAGGGGQGLMSEAGDGLVGGGGSGGGRQGEMLLQQPVRGYGEGYGNGYGDGHGHGRGGASEMAVPDEGAELDRAFGMLEMGK